MAEKQIINVLIVEDISLITEAYFRIITEISTPETSYVPIITENCDRGWEKINKCDFDLIILDLNFPVTSSGQIKSGAQLGQMIRESFPKIKIVVLTGVMERKQLKKIKERIAPQGFLSKGETKSSEIIRCLETVLEGGYYYCEFYSGTLGIKTV